VFGDGALLLRRTTRKQFAHAPSEPLDVLEIELLAAFRGAFTSKPPGLGV
jgi:hypothetical protein